MTREDAEATTEYYLAFSILSMKTLLDSCPVGYMSWKKKIAFTDML